MNHSTTFLARSSAVVCALLLLASFGWSQTTKEENKSDIAKRIDNSEKVLDQIMKTPDKGIPDKIMSKAKCIAIIPSMVKIAVGFGGNHGKGIATCRTQDGRWSALAPITITGGSWGLQLGGQATDLVMVFMSDEGMRHLLSSKFKIGGDISGAAGPVGRDAAADTDIKMKTEILTYSRSRGLFAGVDLHGSVVTQDKDETRVLYGKFEPFEDILDGKVARTASSRAFLRTLAGYTGATTTTSQNTPPSE